MESNDRLTANEFYLNNCMSLLYTKIKAVGLNFFDSKGNISRDNVINIENYEHGTVTFSEKSGAVQVSLDGTDFKGMFYLPKDGRFVYKCKPLNIEYMCCRDEIGEGAYLKKVLRKNGDNVDYFEYISNATFFILLKHCKKDEEGITVVSNNVACKYDKRRLYEYLQEEMAKAQELEDEEDIDLELDDDYYEMTDESRSFFEDRFTKAEQAEINAYSQCDDNDDYTTIDYSLKSILQDKESDEPYFCELPDRVEDFNYKSYIKGVYAKEEQGDESPKSDEELSEENQSQEDVEQHWVSYDEEDDDISAILETCLSEEGFVDDSLYKVTQNDVAVDDERKSDIVDMSVTETMDLNQEVNELLDIFQDMQSELVKIKAIIIKRKEYIDRAKRSSDRPVDKNKTKKEDKNID